MVYVMVLIILTAKLVNIKTPSAMAARAVLGIIGLTGGAQRGQIVCIKAIVDRGSGMMVNIEHANSALPVNLIHPVARAINLVIKYSIKNIKI